MKAFRPLLAGLIALSLTGAVTAQPFPGRGDRWERPRPGAPAGYGRPRGGPYGEARGREPPPPAYGDGRPTNPSGYGFAGPPPDWRGQQDEARAAVREGRHVPLGRVLGEIGRRTPGRQLDTGLESGPDGRPVYRVRWAAANGRRIDYTVDAETGAILGAEGR